MTEIPEDVQALVEECLMAGGGRTYYSLIAEVVARDRASRSPVEGNAGVPIKPLEWERVTAKNDDQSEEAATPFGGYVITADPFTYSPTPTYYVDGPNWFKAQCASIPEARAAAQAHFEAAIRSALAPQRREPEGVAEPVAAPSDLDKLIAFFNEPEAYSRWGHEGDYEGWSTAETAVRALRKVLAASPPGVPEGMVTVPREPTQAMETAFLTNYHVAGGSFSHGYRAMLARTLAPNSAVKEPTGSADGENFYVKEPERHYCDICSSPIACRLECQSPRRAVKEPDSGRAST